MQGGASYELVDKYISKIVDTDHVFYYCQCLKKNFLKNPAVVIISEDIHKHRFFISFKQLEKEVLKQAKEDLKLIKSINGAIELSIITDITYESTDLILKINFKVKGQSQWKLCFSSFEGRKAWISLLNKSICESINKPIRIPREDYSNNQRINDLMAQQVEQIKAVLMQSTTDSTEYKRKIGEFINRFANIGRFLDIAINESPKKDNYQQKFNDLEKEYQILERQKIEWDKEQRTLMEKCQQQAKLIEQLSEQKRVCQELYQRLQNQSSLSETRFQDKISQIEKQSSLSQTRLQDKINQIEEESSTKIKESTLKFQGIITEHEQAFKSQKAQIQQLEAKCKEYEEQLSSLTNTIAKQSKSSQEIQEGIILLEQQKKLIEQQNTQLKQDKKLLEEEIEKLMKKRESNFQRLKEDFKLLQQDKISLESKNRLLEEQKESLLKKCQQSQYQSLFQGDMIHNLPIHKNFLRQTIEAYTKNTIIDTKLLFRYDRHNKINFHVYIDNFPHILIIIKTSVGNYIAGYTEDPFSPPNPNPNLNPNPNPKNRGLIIGLTTQKVFPVMQNKRAITYDDYYILFGNSQIRLKSQQEKVFSNFGIANGYYHTNGSKIEGLMGDTNRDVGIEGYDIYQLFFKS